jgi:hypothetical protein
MTDAEEQIKTLGAQLKEAAKTADEANRTVAGITKILQGYAEMFPELAEDIDEITAGITTSGEDGNLRPRGGEAVRLILQESPGEWFRVSELLPLLRNRGWLPESENPANAVRTALERLVANPNESDVYRGKYTTGPKLGAVVYKYDPDRDRNEDNSEETEGGYGFDEEPF